MANRLAAFFQIRANEARMVAFVAALFAVIELGRGLGANAADGLFFVRYGVAFLPYLYMILGAVTFFVMLTYAGGLGRSNKSGFFLELLLIIAAVLLIERAALLLQLPILYAVLWISVNVISLVLGTFAWSVATEVCDTRQAKRLFSLFTSAGILGGIVGNFTTGLLAKTLGTENLLLLYAALLLVCAALIRTISRRFFKPAAIQPRAQSFVDEIRVGFDFVRSSRLMQILAIGAVLFSILYFSVAFPFSKAVSAAFPNEADVAGFLGIFSGIVTLVTLLVSLFVANRLYTRIGVVNSLLILPITYLAGFILFALDYSLNGAMIARFAQMVVLGGIASSAGSTFYNVVPPEKRAQVQSFDSGVTSQIGIILSGVLLLLGDRVLTTVQIFIVGMIASALTGYLVWRMRKEYASALIAALRAGFLDVFTATQQGLQHLATDTNARRVALAGLADSKPAVRRVSAEILGKMNASEAIVPLSHALSDENAEVRHAALDALVQLRADQSIDQIAARLSDPEPSVRIAAIDALSSFDSRSSSAKVALEKLLVDSDPSVRARAAVACHRMGDCDRARAALDGLLNSKIASAWVAGLEAFAEIRVQLDPTRLDKFLRDPSAIVRCAAVSALGASNNGQTTVTLIKTLDDHDARVRLAAANALSAKEGQHTEISGLLNNGSERAQEAVLIALEGRGEKADIAIVEWALKQIHALAEYRAWAMALHRSKDCSTLRGAAYLQELLQRRESQTTRRVLRALALTGTPDSIRTISKGLQSRDQELRAQAVEALDTLGDSRIARALISLLEEDSTSAPQDASQILRTLASNSDIWLRALAVHAIGEQLSRDLQTLITRAHNDVEPIVREAAMAARSIGVQLPQELGGSMAETLKTLSTMDRILFLRQVSVFSDLEPEDLKQIAEIATERVFESGEYLCREGQVGDEMFVIVDGQVRIVKGSNGEARTLRTLLVGEQIGELAILREQPRSASVIAEEGSVRALVIRGQAIKSILQDRPQVAMAMLASLAQRLSTI